MAQHFERPNLLCARQRRNTRGVNFKTYHTVDRTVLVHGLTYNHTLFFLHKSTLPWSCVTRRIRFIPRYDQSSITREKRYENEAARSSLPRRTNAIIRSYRRDNLSGAEKNFTAREKCLVSLQLTTGCKNNRLICHVCTRFGDVQYFHEGTKNVNNFKCWMCNINVFFSLQRISIKIKFLNCKLDYIHDIHKITRFCLCKPNYENNSILSHLFSFHRPTFNSNMKR